MNKMAEKNIKRAGLWGDIASVVGVLVSAVPTIYGYVADGGNNSLGTGIYLMMVMPILLAELIMLIPTWLAVRRGNTMWAIIWPLIVPVGLILYIAWSITTNWYMYGDFRNILWWPY